VRGDVGDGRILSCSADLPRSPGEKLVALFPGSGYEACFASGQDIHGTLQIARFGCGRFQRREAAKDLFLAAWNKRFPSLLGRRVACKCGAKPSWQSMRGSASILAVERKIDDHAISHCGLGCFPDSAAQIEVKAAIACWHHIYVPWFVRLPVNANHDRKWFAPIPLETLGNPRAHMNIRIDTSNLNDSTESQEQLLD